MPRRLRCCSFALAALSASACATSRDGAALPSTAIVTGVVDGDTIDVRIEGRRERVRLIGIDSPETERPDASAECFGPEASAHAAELLAVGTLVRLVRDVEARDDYGRLLAYVYRASDDLFVNLELVRAGAARPLPVPPNVTFADAFVEAAREAQVLGRGLWSACAG